MQLQMLVERYADLFQDKLGHCKEVQATLKVKSHTTPKFHRPHPIPLAIKEKVETELERLGIRNHQVLTGQLPLSQYTSQMELFVICVGITRYP